MPSCKMHIPELFANGVLCLSKVFMMPKDVMGALTLQVALPFLHEHELPEAVRFEMQQAEEAQKASGTLLGPTAPHC